jgi:pilus assembly protein CpaB
MKPSRLVLLLVAIIAGGLAAFLATRGDGPRQEAVAPPPQIIEEAKDEILVAIAPIGVGERLSAKTVQWQPWPVGAVREEYITRTGTPDALDQVTGAVARFEIFSGDPIIEQKLVRSEQGYLSAVLEKGKRGISIAVTADSASGGFIVPNDHVDVVLTRAGGAGQVSETILRNVKVLAIGKRLGETGATGAPADPDNPRAEVFDDRTIATLELDPGQGELVINASKIGTLSLALRSIADFRKDATEVIAPPSNRTVRIIKFGAQTSVMAGGAAAVDAASASEAVSVDPADYYPPPSPPGAIIEPETGGHIE